MKKIWNKIKRLRSERGSIAVEFAIFIPILLLLIFSIIELGGAWYQKQLLAAASRDGARFGALYSDEGTSDADVETHVDTVLTSMGFPGVAVVDSTGAGSPTGDPVTVTVTANYTFPILSRLVTPEIASLELSSTTVMRNE